MALFTRIFLGFLLVIFHSLAQAGEVAYPPPVNNADPVGSYRAASSYSSNANDSAGEAHAWCGDVADRQNLSTWTCNVIADGGDYWGYASGCRSRWSQQYLGRLPDAGDAIYCFGDPVNEPEPECSIPSGTGEDLVSQSPLGSSTCYQNCRMTTRTSGSVPWIEVNGSRTYFYTGTSTGDYCDSTSGAAPAQPWESYTDENGCYLGFDGRYCPGGGGDCPNSVTAPNGERFCRMPPDQEDCNEAGGSSGDAYCGQDDPNYQEPVSGDGGDDECDPETEDCSGDGGDDSGGEPGDGGGDGGSGDGDGDDDASAPGDGELVGGECTQETRKGPDCSDNMNATECAFGLQLWQARCDQKLAHEDIVGTDEYRDGDSLLSESDANQVGNTEVDFSEALSDLDDSGSGFGGAASCPADRTINLAGFGTIKIPMTFICQWAEKIRPLIIALGWLSAGLIVLSSMRGK